MKQILRHSLPALFLGCCLGTVTARTASDSAPETTQQTLIERCDTTSAPDSVKSFADRWQFCGIAVEEAGYHLWGASPIRDDTGRIHLFVTRWRIEHAFDPGWRSHSEIAHYVADTPEGPFLFSDVALAGTGRQSWDRCGVHNPTIHRIGDKYYLLYISNDDYHQPPHPANQRIGMAVADNLAGPWKRVGNDGCILRPSDNPAHWTYHAPNGVVNPALLVHPNGGYLLYFKSAQARMGVAFADQPEGPYVLYPHPVTQNNQTIEDGFAFMMDGDNHGILGTGGGILWRSKNGIEFDRCEPGFHRFERYLPDGALNHARQIYGAIPKFERPQLLMEAGRPAYLYVPSGANIKGGKETLVHVLKYCE